MSPAATNGGPARGRTSELLRLATSGSVDDGKSTLIGRLLYDSKQVLDDQIEHIERASRLRGDDFFNLALLTDGLRAERERGITIDVAYRYFSTARRKFIIADTPGHLEYTRNMVTGASTADLSIVLLDARHGVREQSKRHAFIASLLHIPHLVVCVNKMDLVGWDVEVFERISEEFSDFAALLDVPDVTFIPLSALHGDNVVDRSERMPWYDGPSLLYHLEHVHIAADRNLVEPRFPVQLVLDGAGAPHVAGQVAGGVLEPGDEVVVLPAGTRTRIASIETYDGAVARAFPPMSAALVLDDDAVAGRGDVVCGIEDQPAVARELEATVCWMSQAPLRPGARLAIKHTTRSAGCSIEEIEHVIDVETLERRPAPRELALNDIGRIRLTADVPLAFDPYARNRTTGSFILVDDATNDTVAAGMIVGATT
jgi:bifunctional enzyme CysN/CysC